MTQLQHNTLYVLSRDRRGLLFSWLLPRNTSFSPKPWRIPSVFKTGSLSYVQGKWNRVDVVAPNHFGRGDQRYKNRSETSCPTWSHKVLPVIENLEYFSYGSIHRFPSRGQQHVKLWSKILLAGSMRTSASLPFEFTHKMGTSLAVFFLFPRWYLYLDLWIYPLSLTLFKFCSKSSVIIL